MLPGAGILGAIGRIASKHAKVVSQVLGTRSPHKKHSGKISSEPNMIAAENGSDQEDMDTKEGMFEVYVVLLFVVCLSSNCIVIQIVILTLDVSLSDSNLVSNGSATPKESEDVPMEEDTARPEGTVQFVVPHFSKLKETVLSDPIYVRNLPW